MGKSSNNQYSVINKDVYNRVQSLCKYYRIDNYSINSDGTINVYGDVNLGGMALAKLPLRFGEVTGDFICNYNNLQSLDGCPHKVGGNFNCLQNNLTTLNKSPTVVGGSFVCAQNRLVSLVGSPLILFAGFDCNHNKLESLEDGPIVVMGSYSCQFNNLTSLLGSPQHIGFSFNCSHNILETLEDGPVSIGINFDCSENRISSLVGMTQTIGGSLYLYRNFQLDSTYSGDIDVQVGERIMISPETLPGFKMIPTYHLALVLKYQRHFYIWNDDLTLNKENLADLLLEIEDGLK